jgi:hypothetical protein
MIDILNKVYEYQYKNNVKGECIINTIFYIELSEILYPENTYILVNGLLTYFNSEDNINICVSHCWCLVNGNIIDPSIEFLNIPYKTYYYSNIQEYFNMIKENSPDEYKYDKTVIIKNTCNLQKLVNEFTKNIKMSTDYYNKLRDYIFKHFSLKQKIFYNKQLFYNTKRTHKTI